MLKGETGVRKRRAIHLFCCRLAPDSSPRVPSNQVRVELAFQSADSFADGYIEAPDDAYAPPPTGWRRNDTNFQLLVYYDPANRQSDQVIPRRMLGRRRTAGLTWRTCR